MIKKFYYKIESLFPPLKVLRKTYRKFFKGPKRYKYLFKFIKKNKCKRIMEIGTWDGEHALQMIKEAQKFPGNEVEYYGFDLFELLDEKTSQKEFSKEWSDSKFTRPWPSLRNVENKLKKTGARIHLFQGNTKDTLPKVIRELPKMDFVFIDGGHDIETVENDWKYVQQVMSSNTIVIFDDYWNREDGGCKKTIKKIDKAKFKVKVLPGKDKFKKDWGILKTNFVKVQRNVRRQF